MKPRSAASADSGDLFRAELATILNPKHELILLADRIDWSQMDQRVAPLFADEGRPATPPRLMIGRSLGSDLNANNISRKFFSEMHLQVGLVLLIPRGEIKTVASTRSIPGQLNL